MNFDDTGCFGAFASFTHHTDEAFFLSSKSNRNHEDMKNLI